MRFIKMYLPLLISATILMICQAYSFNPPPEVGFGSKLEIINPNLMQFSNKLFKIASKNKSENIVTSPLSTYLALSAITNGARENTAQELRDALNLPINNEVSTEAHLQLLDFLEITQEEGGKPMIKLLNKLFLNNRYSIKPEFQNLINISFPLTLLSEEELDLTNLENAVNSINNWISGETNSDVKDIIKTGDLNESASMFLVNFMHFKGEWSGIFDKNRTVDSPFYTSEQNYSVPMMRRESVLSYGILSDLNAKFIEIPYKDSDLILLIILPDKVDGLEEMEQKLENVTIKNIREKGVYRFMELNLPRLKIESAGGMKNILQEMGINQMFTDSANFRGISNSSIHVNEVFQKTLIEVVEGKVPSYYRPGTVKPVTEGDFTVNHPFHFKIIKPGYRRDGITVFAGNCKKF